MATTKYTYPSQLPSGSGTFSDNLVGFQLVQGGGLTQGNFVFTDSVTEKNSRNFIIGLFSEPISLDTLQVESIEESRRIVAKNFKVFPNFDLSDVTNFTLFGSLSKRLETSVQKIINFFPAAIEVSYIRSDFTTGTTASLISFNSVSNSTYFEIDVSIMLNPFEIDYSTNSTRNLQSREIEVAGLRNFTSEFTKYALFVNDVEYDIISVTPTTSLSSGQLKIYVNGNPFSGATSTSDYLIIRPQNYYTEEAFAQNFDEVEKFLLNRLVSPPYTATFQIPQSTNDGTYFTSNRQVTWPLDGRWNLDIRTISFDGYLNTLGNIANTIDEYKTNLISRFLTTDSLKEFDTPDQKFDKVLQIYGRSFDEVKHFVDALAYMNSVNYNIQNDIPSQLLKNLAETLGWQTNISPISNEDFLNSVFGNTTEVLFPGLSRSQTPDEVNFQYYRNLILNSAYLFKSKGTRKSIEGLMRLIGAPDALIDFNETIYLADQRIDMSQFNTSYASITGGTYVNQVPTLDPMDTFSILGRVFTGFTTTPTIEDVNTTRDDYPVDDEGYPKMPTESESFFFQKGAGWYETTSSHRSPEKIDITTSVFTGENMNIQTQLEPFTYGQKYLQRYRKFPYFNLGYKLTRVYDNKKSWTENQTDSRNFFEANFNSRYVAVDDRLVLNVKNIDVFLNPAQGLTYDVWYMSTKYDYPIPESGFTAPYPGVGGVDWTMINPEPKKLTFFEFAQTFWQNMINVRDRLFSFDGKTSGYPLLQKMWWLYLQSDQNIGVPNDNFTYRNMIDYVVGLGDYWLKLVEQMVPATTIWNGGLRYENSSFHRQKFVWRRQVGCRIIPVPCEPCTLVSRFYPLSCSLEESTCFIYPVDSNGNVANFNTILYEILALDGVDLNICDPNTISSTWSIKLKINGSEISSREFFYGIGASFISSVPSVANYTSSLQLSLQDLFVQGFGYQIVGNDAKIYNLDCIPDHLGQDFEIVLGINYTIECVN